MKVIDMTDQDTVKEREIARAAVLVLQKCFIEAARNGTVMYVDNNIVWSKAPNSPPVLFKKLSGRNPNLAKKFASRGTYKIKK
jgi:hypothetical protein